MVFAVVGDNRGGPVYKPHCPGALTVCSRCPHWTCGWSSCLCASPWRPPRPSAWRVSSATGTASPSGGKVSDYQSNIIRLNRFTKHLYHRLFSNQSLDRCWKSFTGYRDTYLFLYQQVSVRQLFISHCITS